MSSLSLIDSYRNKIVVDFRKDFGLPDFYDEKAYGDFKSFRNNFKKKIDCSQYYGQFLAPDVLWMHFVKSGRMDRMSMVENSVL